MSGYIHLMKGRRSAVVAALAVHIESCVRWAPRTKPHACHRAQKAHRLRPGAPPQTRLRAGGTPPSAPSAACMQGMWSATCAAHPSSTVRGAAGHHRLSNAVFHRMGGSRLKAKSSTTRPQQPTLPELPVQDRREEACLLSKEAVAGGAPKDLCGYAALPAVGRKGHALVQYGQQRATLLAGEAGRLVLALHSSNRQAHTQCRPTCCNGIASKCKAVALLMSADRVSSQQRNENLFIHRCHTP